MRLSSIRAGAMTGETSRVIERLERNYNLTTLQKPYEKPYNKPPATRLIAQGCKVVRYDWAGCGNLQNGRGTNSVPYQNTRKTLISPRTNLTFLQLHFSRQ